MALVFTFPCGGCGRRYTVYYPKALLYRLSGTGTAEMGRREDEEDERSGAVEAARRRAEASGHVWVNAAETQQVVCACGKHLDVNIAHHPRVPQGRGTSRGRQAGFISLSAAPRGRAGGPAGGHGTTGS